MLFIIECFNRCIHVPTEESVKRSVDRDGFAEEAVRKRISAQIPLEERVRRSNAVISTLWEPEITQKIVEKAWDNLISNRLVP